VAANFTYLLTETPMDFLSSSCDFIVNNFNSKLRTTLDKVTPPKIKRPIQTQYLHGEMKK